MPITYEGVPPQSRQTCFWRIRAWDQVGAASPWSETAHWTMGQLDASDWQAQWVALRPEAKAERPAAHYRRSFHLDRVPRRALPYATARGIYTWPVNGRPVSDALFRPGWTNYHVRIPYQCYDVTALLHPGENVTVAGAYTVLPSPSRSRRRAPAGVTWMVHSSGGILLR